MEREKMSKVIEAVKTEAVATRSKKATKVVVEQVKQLTNLRAEVKNLEATAKQIVKVLEVEFGKNDTEKTSKFDTLIHNNIDVVRLDWRVRPNFSSDKFTEELSKSVAVAYPELAEALTGLIAEAVAKATSETKFTVINTLYK
jgi:hypothetical protein